jgi:hypothetical protein
MAQKDQLSQWANIAKIAAAIIALGALAVNAWGFIRESRNVPDLRYTILPTYDVKDMAFSGIVVENRGRTPALNVNVILTDLENVIQLLHVPGPYGKKAHIDWDPDNPTNEAMVKMDSLPQGLSQPIYLLTNGSVTLAEGETFTVYSDKGKARLSSELGSSLTWAEIILFAFAFLGAMTLIVWLENRVVPFMAERSVKRSLEKMYGAEQSRKHHTVEKDN